LCGGIVIVSMLASVVAAAGGAEPATTRAPSTASAPVAGDLPLSFQRTELTLFDGRKVQGELDTHLVLYSPGLGTLKSFRKEFIASYTKGTELVKLAAPL